MVGNATGSQIGVLALQGDVREHMAALAEIGVGATLVRRPEDLSGLAGCVLPGGESTTLSMLLTSTGLWDPLGECIADGFPVFGTCAGLVLLASEVLDGRDDQRSFGALDVVVQRNGFGRQLQSFEAMLALDEALDATVGATPPAPLPAVFIRAPKVVRAGRAVQVLARVERNGVGEGDGPIGSSPVLVRQGNLLASVFHPELTKDRRLHRLFAEMCGC